MFWLSGLLNWPSHWPLYWLEIAILIGAALLDYSLGDPWHWPHPVQAMGWIIRHYSDRCLQRFTSPKLLRGLGLLLGLSLIVGTGLFTWGILQVTAKVFGTVISAGLSVILLASCFAGKSLQRAALDVLRPLDREELTTARQKLALYVGRDTATLSKAEVQRAVLETVSENATDGVLAPLFYALLGAALGMGSVPLAMAYKAASTLDSMVGYRTPPYRDLGWFSARFEDGLTWLPCRLVVLTTAFLSGRPLHVWRLCRQDAIADPSPNAGWSECAYAAALGVQVGGANTYQGQLQIKPKLGIAERSITPPIIYQALQLTRQSFLIWLGCGCGLLGLMGLLA